MDEHGAVWPWNENRDRKTPKASLPGADIVGFLGSGPDTVFLFGEVKTSSDKDNPPGVMAGRGGLAHQIDSLASRASCRRSSRICSASSRACFFVCCRRHARSGDSPWGSPSGCRRRIRTGRPCLHPSEERLLISVSREAMARRSAGDLSLELVDPVHRTARDGERFGCGRAGAN